MLAVGDRKHWGRKSDGEWSLAPGSGLDMVLQAMEMVSLRFQGTVVT